jgi:hypothetical protein
VNSTLRRLPGLPAFKYVFECGIAAFCSLTSYLNSPKCLAKSDDKERGIFWCGMVRGENIGSYSDSNKLRHTQESATKGSKDPNSATLC